MDLKTWLKMNGISQQDFAGTVGIKPSALSMMLKGKSGIPPKVAYKMQEASNNEVTVDELMMIKEGIRGSAPTGKGTLLTEDMRREVLARAQEKLKDSRKI